MSCGSDASIAAAAALAAASRHHRTSARAAAAPEEESQQRKSSEEKNERTRARERPTLTLETTAPVCPVSCLIPSTTDRRRRLPLLPPSPPRLLCCRCVHPSIPRLHARACVCLDSLAPHVCPPSLLLPVSLPPCPALVLVPSTLETLETPEEGGGPPRSGDIKRHSPEAPAAAAAAAPGRHHGICVRRPSLVTLTQETSLQACVLG